MRSPRSPPPYQSYRDHCDRRYYDKYDKTSSSNNNGSGIGRMSDYNSHNSDSGGGSSVNRPSRGAIRTPPLGPSQVSPNGENLSLKQYVYMSTFNLELYFFKLLKLELIT